jgi:hypothetical protein
VSTSRVTDNSHSVPLIRSAKFILVESSSVVKTVDSVAVVVQQLGTRLTPGIDVSLDFVAVGGPPVIAPKGGDV